MNNKPSASIIQLEIFRHHFNVIDIFGQYFLLEIVHQDIIIIYFRRGMLGLNESPGIENIGMVKWQLALCLLAVYVICYFSLWKGISTSGKVGIAKSNSIRHIKSLWNSVPVNRLDFKRFTA